MHVDAAHTITQADVDAGVVTNTATASGTNPAGTDGAVEQLVGLDARSPRAPRCS